MDDELEMLRRKRLMQLQSQLQRQIQAQAVSESEAEAMEEERNAILRQILTTEARQRLANLKLVRPEFAAQIESQLLYLVQIGRIRQVIDDETLKNILRRLQAQKKEVKIKRM